MKRSKIADGLDHFMGDLSKKNNIIDSKINPQTKVVNNGSTLSSGNPKAPLDNNGSAETRNNIIGMVVSSNLLSKKKPPPAIEVIKIVENSHQSPTPAPTQKQPL